MRLISSGLLNRCTSLSDSTSAPENCDFENVIFFDTSRIFKKRMPTAGRHRMSILKSAGALTAFPIVLGLGPIFLLMPPSAQACLTAPAPNPPRAKSVSNVPTAAGVLSNDGDAGCDGVVDKDENGVAGQAGGHHPGHRSGRGWPRSAKWQNRRDGSRGIWRPRGLQT